MRPQYLVGIIIGILLLYLGFMGAAGIGLSWSSTTLPTREEFNSTMGWTIDTGSSGEAPTINPSGQLQLQAAASGADDRSALASNTGPWSEYTAYTITVYMKVDSWAGGYINIQIYTTNMFYSFNIYQDKVQSYMNKETWTLNLDTGWHSYSIAVNGQSQDFFMDSNKLGTTTSSFSGGFQPRLSLDAWNGLLCHIDYVDVELGNVNPTPSPTQNPTSPSPIQNPSPSPIQNPSPSPSGEQQWNITSSIADILNSSPVRQFEMAAGGLTALACGVMFIMPARRYAAPRPYQNY